MAESVQPVAAAAARLDPVGVDTGAESDVAVAAPIPRSSGKGRGAAAAAVSGGASLSTGSSSRRSVLQLLRPSSFRDSPPPPPPPPPAPAASATAPASSPSAATAAAPAAVAPTADAASAAAGRSSSSSSSKKGANKQLQPQQPQAASSSNSNAVPSTAESSSSPGTAAGGGAVGKTALPRSGNSSSNSRQIKKQQRHSLDLASIAAARSSTSPDAVGAVAAVSSSAASRDSGGRHRNAEAQGSSSGQQHPPNRTAASSAAASSRNSSSSASSSDRPGGPAAAAAGVALTSSSPPPPPPPTGTAMMVGSASMPDVTALVGSLSLDSADSSKSSDSHDSASDRQQQLLQQSRPQQVDRLVVSAGHHTPRHHHHHHTAEDVFQRLLLAEHQYVSSLDMLLRVYVRPLEQLGDAYITRQALREVFGEVDAFRALHGRLLDQLQQLLQPLPTSSLSSTTVASASSTPPPVPAAAADPLLLLTAVLDALALMLETLEWAYEAAMTGYGSQLVAFQEALRRSPKLLGPWLDKRLLPSAGSVAASNNSSGGGGGAGRDPLELLLSPLRHLAACAALVRRLREHYYCAPVAADGAASPPPAAAGGRQPLLLSDAPDAAAMLQQLATRFDALDRRLQAEAEQSGDEQLQLLLISSPSSSFSPSSAASASAATSAAGPHQQQTPVPVRRGSSGLAAATPTTAPARGGDDGVQQQQQQQAAHPPPPSLLGAAEEAAGRGTGAGIRAHLQRADQLYQLWRIQRCLVFADGKSEPVIRPDRRLVLCGRLTVVDPPAPAAGGPAGGLRSAASASSSSSSSSLTAAHGGPRDLRQPCTALLFNDRLMFATSTGGAGAAGRRRAVSNPPTPSWLAEQQAGATGPGGGSLSAHGWSGTRSPPIGRSQFTEELPDRPSSKFTSSTETLRVVASLDLGQCVVLNRRLTSAIAPASVDSVPQPVLPLDPSVAATAAPPSSNLMDPAAAAACSADPVAATAPMGSQLPGGSSRPSIVVKPPSSDSSAAGAAVIASAGSPPPPPDELALPLASTDFQLLVLYEGEYTISAPTDADRALWVHELDRCSQLRRPVFREPAATEAQRSAESRLSEREWQLILGHAQHLPYPMNHTILPSRAAGPCDTIYRVLKGRVRLERQETDGRDKVYTLARLPEGSVFGEAALLGRPEAQYAVVADAEQVVVAAIELAFVTQIFRVHPGVAVKFFRHIAFSLTQRLNALPSSLLLADDALHEAILRFNLSCKLGARYAVEQGVVDGTAAAMARFLRHAELDKRKIGEYLGEPEEFNREVLRNYVESFDFSGLSIDEGLRAFVATFRLPGEAQKIDRMMEAFSKHYFAATCCGPQSFGAGCLFSNSDQVYVLSFSMMMLNTDLHNDAIKRKMSRAEWVRNNRGLNNGADFDEAMLLKIYDRILHEKFSLSDDIDPSDAALADTPEAESRPAPGAGRVDAVVQRRFGLPPDEIVLKEYACALKRAGALSITKRHLCFYSKVFGIKDKKRVPLSDVVSISRGRGPLELCVEFVTTGRKRHLLKLTLTTVAARDEAHDLLLSLCGAAASVDVSLQTAGGGPSPSASISLPAGGAASSLLLPLASTTNSGELPLGSSVGPPVPSTAVPRLRSWLELTQDDWDLLLSRATFLTLPPNTELIAEGEPYARLYQVVKGIVRIEQNQVMIGSAGGAGVAADTPPHPAPPAAAARLRHRRTASVDERARARALFDRFSGSVPGFLLAHEFAKLATSLSAVGGVSLSPDLLKSAFDSLDRGQSGRISFEAFWRFWISDASLSDLLLSPPPSPAAAAAAASADVHSEAGTSSAADQTAALGSSGEAGLLWLKQKLFKQFVDSTPLLKRPSRRVLGRMDPGEVLGEISYLTGQGASASVVADTDVDCYAIDGQFLDALFAVHVPLAVRFFKFVAALVHKRLSIREDALFSKTSNTQRIRPLSQLVMSQSLRNLHESSGGSTDQASM